MRRLAWFGLLALMGCDRNDRLDLAGRALDESAERCLYEVRDSGKKYDAAPSCTALSALSLSYVEAGGTGSEPALYRVRFMSAQRMAWMALAMSESCSGKPLRIW